jgi:transcriptional regulator with XRE-family HTH domain
MFWERYDALCRSIGLSANAVAKVLGCSSGSVTSWKNGKVPHHGTLLKIAKYFGVSVDYLLGKYTPADTTDPIDAEIARLFPLLKDEDKADVLRYIEFLRQKNGGK